VLTEEHYFRGALDHLSSVRRAVGIPLLRKDFIFDPYQVYEARAWGADAFLLIAAILSPGQLQDLYGQGRELGLEPLIEVHKPAELENVLSLPPPLLGINNATWRASTWIWG